MGKKLKYLLLVSVFLGACASGHCRKGQTVVEPEGPEAVLSPKKRETSKEKTIFIYKYDGTLQCAQGKEISLDQMAEELVGLTIYSQEKRHDGMLRVQVCGQSTGRANVYEIKQMDLNKAQAQGFEEWTFK